MNATMNLTRERTPQQAQAQFHTAAGSCATAASASRASPRIRCGLGIASRCGPGDAESAAPRAAAFPAQGEARHLPFPGRRAESPGTVRPQARADEAQWPASAAELLKGYRAAFINPNSALLGPQVQVRPARPVRDGVERDCCRTPPRSPTTSASSARCRPRRSTTPRRRS